MLLQVISCVESVKLHILPPCVYLSVVLEEENLCANSGPSWDVK